MPGSGRDVADKTLVACTRTRTIERPTGEVFARFSALSEMAKLSVLALGGDGDKME